MSDADDVERTPDGRFIIVGGRRWRASDPSIPAALRTELVHELMDARRAVRDAAGDDAAVRAARARVQDAKVALGERGEPWWEEPTPGGQAERIAAAIRALAAGRAPRTTCPSDAARAVGGDRWRGLMEATRDVARGLANAGDIEILQRGEPVDPNGTWKGPVRIRSARRNHD